jgi:hypothetical protein
MPLALKRVRRKTTDVRHEPQRICELRLVLFPEVRLMTILLITNTEDGPSVDAVVSALQHEGADAFRLETDCFPTQISLAAWHDASRSHAQIITPGRTIDLASVTAVWHRRWNTAAQLSTILDGDVLKGSERESDTTLQGLIGALPCFHFDDPAALYRARNRHLQLELAAELGLETPRTLMTNDPRAIRQFADACGGAIIVKMLSSFSVRDVNGVDHVVMTSDVTPEHLARIESIALCPMTFQEKILKALELRVTIVGHDVFAASIDSNQVESGRTDWRRAMDELSPHWKPYELPTRVRSELLTLLDRLELNYGAIDVIVTPDGRYVFLEVNPVGQFGWIEDAVGYPIAASIAGLLTGRLPRRVEVPHKLARSRL